MTGRYSYDKGSSRSTRDDSRPPREKERHRDRSRSRSPTHRSRRSRERSERSSSSKDYDRRRDYDDKYESKPRYEEPEEVPAPPPPPRITKISIGFNKPTSAGPIKMSFGGPTKTPVPKPTIASVFSADDDDDEPEEMPAEAKMRMRNIGRETPTSAGPNSFGKTKQGFCDAKKVFEKNLKSALDQAETNKPSLSKLPQTIYKIKGP